MFDSLIPGSQESNAADATWSRLVAPENWQNPVPSGRYHLVILGGGPAGLVAAAGAASLGARVALVERSRLGGDCLNWGCVPSKALLKSARVAATVRDAGPFGVRVPDGVRVDFEAAMSRLRSLRASLAVHDSAERFRQLGVDLFFGEGRFAGPDTMTVEGRSLRFRRALVATGATPLIPEIDGLSSAGFVTNESVFDLKARPRRLLVLGGGPIGCELAQAFARLGSEVTVVEASDRLLPRESPKASEWVASSLRNDGVIVHCQASVLRVEQNDSERHVSWRTKNGSPGTLSVDELLVCVGRRPNVASLGLEAAGINFDMRQGVRVDDFLRTSNRRIFAAGDVCSKFQFTHAADAMARIVLRNALFPGRARRSSLLIPRCTYTDPEVASVGLTEAEARERNIAVDCFIEEFRNVDRAILDGETSGFAQILVQRGRDKIVGATVVGASAGEMLNEVTLAMNNGLGLQALASMIRPYPTRAEIIKRLADQFQRRQLTPFVQRCFQRWFAWTK